MEAGGNTYEEARKQRVQENLKRFEGMGISTISKSLLEVAKSESKKYSTSPKQKKNLVVSELRRSSRDRNVVHSYQYDELVGKRIFGRKFPQVEDIDLRSLCRSYTRRAYSGLRLASYEERVHAVKRAEKLQANLKSSHPSFVKPMVRSHVSGCFWLGLPTKFCKDHLPPSEVKMILEDENSAECETVYIASRTGLSGGWRGFSLDHKLDDGDALLFELAQPRRFKIYIIKATEHPDQEIDVKTSNGKPGTDKSVHATRSSECDVSEKKLKSKTRSTKRVKRPPKRSAWG